MTVDTRAEAVMRTVIPGQELFMGIEEVRAGVLKAQRPLPPHTVHVWRTPFAAVASHANEMNSLLSADEQERAQRFRFPQQRDVYIAGRALLRMILASYCGCRAEGLVFAYGAQGKPRIDRAASHLSRTLSFSVAHSRRALQIAVAAEGELGIDVEDVTREFEVEGLIAACLTGPEAALLSGLDAMQRANAFLRYWVHKEAFLKCMGTGFSVSPKEVHVRFISGGCSEIRCSNPMAERVLFGRDLESEPGHVAGIAVADPDWEFQPIVL